ncbi:MAG: hypothetical protein E7365_07565 [Clostridiales bacterium]|nr:hypothetical protein [Clostridiales bacterium]
MKFWQDFLRILDFKMEKPEPYGWFHLMFFALSIIAAIILCLTHKKDDVDRPRKVVLITAITVIVLEIYKLVNYSFSYENGITFDFEWYAFPWQFCSTPMYVGLLAGLFKKGKVHDALSAYLATYALFAGVSVMFYPTTVFISTMGVNIQTMICHGSMITIGIYLLYSGYVKIEHKSILKALPVFSVAVLIAVILNELAYFTGLLETDTFNMFFVSRHCEPSLPVYSIVQGIVPYPWCLIIYIVGFTLAAYIMLLIAMLIKKINIKKSLA